MKKFVNVLCVLILAVMLIDLVIDFFYTGGSSIAITVDFDSYSLGLFALLMGEVFGIGMNLQEGKKTAA